MAAISVRNRDRVSFHRFRIFNRPDKVFFSFRTETNLRMDGTTGLIGHDGWRSGFESVTW